MNEVSKTLVGLNILGTFTVENATNIFLGIHDEYLKYAVYFTIYRNHATSETNLDTPEVQDGLNRIKTFFKNSLVSAMNKEIELMEKEANRKRLEEFRKMNQPHALGTVAEIATKYNISKGEVRRMKAEGTLESYVQMKTIM